MPTPPGLPGLKRAAPDGPSRDDEANKSRRRAVSCISCQRMKCRCDYDFALQSCTRCYNLKSPCSRKDTPPRIPLSENEVDARFSALEQRLQKHDQTLAEVSQLLRSLKTQQDQPVNLDTRLDHVIHLYGQQQAGIAPASAPAPGRPLATMSMNDVATPARAEAGQTPLTAPLMVIRDIGSRFPAPLRKVRRPTTVKIIDEGMLDVDTARGLLEAFPGSSYNSVLLPEITTLGWDEEYRNGLPFLHSVCCLNVIADRREMAQTMLHRRIFERVKAALGLVLLDHSPSLDDIQGILMCTDSFRVGAGDGNEFIDSWMLTGYCVKQGMLAIDFDRITRETREGQSSAANVRAIRLWSTICLHHLHWTAASGRPSTIAESYLGYCPLLLSFYDATVQDGILLAEVFLYSKLLAVLDKPPELDDTGDCDAFAAWRHEWRHLLALPAAAMLKMGYAAACLLLVVRGLERQGEQLSPAAFLSRDSSSTSPAAASTSSPSGGDNSPDPSLRRAAARQSQTLLQTFLGMPGPLQDSISSNRCLCLTYGALMLTHYDRAQSHLEDGDSLRLVRRLHAWFGNSPSKVVLARYTSLCEHIITSRIDKTAEAGHPTVVAATTGAVPFAIQQYQQQHQQQQQQQQDLSHSALGGDLTIRSMHQNLGLASHATMATAVQMNEDGIIHGNNVTSQDTGDMSALFDLLPSINMEEFFAGGYLDL
ncbi:transcriptional regulatory protein LEU3 [Microdochium nivale]|nr:transcriptional regulatory protein LEU3 [Microdochium nivale]